MQQVLICLLSGHEKFNWYGAFVNPSLLLVSLRDPYMDSDRVMPPLGVMSLHSYMLDRGIDSRIENDFKIHDMKKYGEFTHIAISCMTPQKNQAYEILDSIKENYPGKKVIIGGPHADFYLEECRKKPFDHIVTGDGEISLLKILTGEEKRRIVNFPVDAETMNSFPLPYREPEFLNQYCFYIQGVRATTVLTAKGCPMKCAFCEHAQTELKLYKPEIVGRQIDQVKNAGFNAVMFFDDIFCLSLNRAKALANEIIKKNIIYRCFAHAKNMNEEIANILVNSGCIEIGFGAETGSQQILDNVNKQSTVSLNRKLVDICNSHGIKVKAFIMVGLPGENRNTIQETEKFLECLMSRQFKNFQGRTITNDFDITIYFPYKGTQIRDSIDRKINNFDLYIKKNPDMLEGFYKGKHGASQCSIGTSGLSAEEIAMYRELLFNRYKQKVIA